MTTKNASSTPATIHSPTTSKPARELAAVGYRHDTSLPLSSAALDTLLNVEVIEAHSTTRICSQDLAVEDVACRNDTLRWVFNFVEERAFNQGRCVMTSVVCEMCFPLSSSGSGAKLPCQGSFALVRRWPPCVV